MTVHAAPPPEPEAPTLEGALGFLGKVWAFSHALDSRSKWMATHHGVTGPQRMAIRILGRFPGLPAGALARHLHLHPSTLTGVLQRLEERGYVARAKDTSDSRRAILVLTKLGRGMDMPRDGTVERCVENVLARHSPDEIALVERVLAELSDELLDGLG